jgi:hypothetical protein
MGIRRQMPYLVGVLGCFVLFFGCWAIQNLSLGQAARSTPLDASLSPTTSPSPLSATSAPSEDLSQSSLDERWEVATREQQQASANLESAKSRVESDLSSQPDYIAAPATCDCCKETANSASGFRGS